MLIVIAAVIGFILDLILGERLTAICPAVLFGKLIAALEPPLRSLFPKTDRGEFWGGVLMVFAVCFVAVVIPAVILYFVWMIPVAGPWIWTALQAFWFYQIMATRGLKDAAMLVYNDLAAGNLDQARVHVGWIVGRDTDRLDEAGITRATVETVAENSADGCIAPLFYFVIGGAPLAMLYKAINTMDSMLGYKNDVYRHFGTCAARTDDVANFIPARFSAILIAAAALLTGCDAKGAWRIWRRDHAKSTSPNSGHSETAMAGALGVRLLGDAYYFGKLVHKESIGDEVHPIVPDDIKRANRILYAASTLCLVLCCAVRALCVLLIAM